MTRSIRYRFRKTLILPVERKLLVRTDQTSSNSLLSMSQLHSHTPTTQHPLPQGKRPESATPAPRADRGCWQTAREAGKMSGLWGFRNTKCRQHGRRVMNNWNMAAAPSSLPLHCPPRPAPGCPPTPAAHRPQPLLHPPALQGEGGKTPLSTPSPASPFHCSG